ncbi:MAG: hypothetical protein V1676_00175 [Candidatus Diapherotrites archaeon]
MNKKRAERMAIKFLSYVWEKRHLEIEKTPRTQRLPRFPLPNAAERVHGGRMGKGDIAGIKKQAAFAARVFARHLGGAKQRQISKKIFGFFSKKTLSIKDVLLEKGPSPKEMRRSGKELYTKLKGTGQMYHGFIRDGYDLKIAMVKGWRTVHGGAMAAPLHEAIHALHELGYVKFDAPFAEAADRLYSLENGFLKLDGRIGKPRAHEFDINFNARRINEEPEWTYPLGRKIGQWVYMKLPQEKRWDYLYHRCMGKRHAEALEEIGVRGTGALAAK